MYHSIHDNQIPVLGRASSGGTGQALTALIEAAVLAANAHNSQPWKFRMHDAAISICADLTRHLGSFDPFRREMYLSLGCALENLVLAARACGLSPRVELVPGTLPPQDDAEATAAIVHFDRGEQLRSELFEAIGSRRTHRGAYAKGKGLSEQVMNSVQSLAVGSSEVRLRWIDEPAKRRLAELIVASTRQIVDDAEMAKDSAHWFRFHPQEVREHCDGLTLDTNIVSPLVRTIAKMLPPSHERANRQWVRDTRRIHVGTAAALGVICVRDLYDRPTAIGAGRLWQRIHLLLTAHGIAAQPLNQAIERVDREQDLGAPPATASALGQIIPMGDWRPTFIFRAGYARRDPRRSPRRAVRDVMA
jgi:hypothetical protein